MPVLPSSLAAGLPPDASLLPALAAMLPTGVGCAAPVRDSAGQIVDFILLYLNPAAQQLLGVPASPAATLTELFPASRAGGQLTQLTAAYQHPHPGPVALAELARASTGGFRATGQRVDDHLLVLLAPVDEPTTDPQLAQLARERDAAHTEAERQREQLVRLFRQAPALVNTQLGPDHVFDLVHPLTYQLLGHRPLVGLPSRQALPELEGPFHDLLDEVYRTGQPFHGREVHARLDRQGDGQLDEAYFDFTYQPLRGADGTVEGVMTFAVEVTAQVHARRRIEEFTQELEARVAARTAQARVAQAEADAQRHRLEALLQQAPALIASLTGPRHMVELANASFQALFGARPLVGRPYAEAVPELVAQGFIDLLDEVYRTGHTHHGHEVLAVIEPPDQPVQQRYFNFIYQPTRAATGEVEGVLIMAYDVTAQVDARRQLERHRAELERLFAQAPVAIAILRGPELLIELANVAVGQIWGRDPAQVLGRPYFAAMPETVGQGFEQILGGVLTSGQPFFVTEAPVRLARLDHDGAPVQAYVNFGFHPLRDEHQRVTGVMAVGTEVTEQVHARQQVQALNQELQATVQQLRSVNQDLDTFQYTASHDLKAPITNIEGLLQVLREELGAGPPSDPVGHVLALMQGAVDRFRTTLGHLTEITRLQADELPTAPVDLADVVAGVQLDLAPLLTTTHAQVRVDIGECPALRVPAKTLRSVIYNLLSNALKYRHPDHPTQVQIRCREEGPYAVLEVQDNGLGIDLTRQPELFGLFRRYHTHVEGSGVGLYTVKRMVEHAGGHITVHSQVNQGTTFTVQFPLPNDQATEA